MLKEWGFKSAELDSASSQAFTEFRTALKTLKESELNTKKISLALDTAGSHFDGFETMLGLSGTGARLKVSEKADYLLLYFNKITGMYQKVAEK